VAHEVARMLEVPLDVFLVRKLTSRAVGQWYREFSQTSDEEVRELLREHAEPRRGRDDHGSSRRARPTRGSLVRTHPRDEIDVPETYPIGI
jgi:hypothetical protein